MHTHAFGIHLCRPWRMYLPAIHARQLRVETRFKDEQRKEYVVGTMQVELMTTRELCAQSTFIDTLIT